MALNRGLTLRAPTLSRTGDSNTAGEPIWKLLKRLIAVGMKQKVVIRALVKRRDRILLLRRSGGRASINGLYELPGGSLHVGEQPVDALKRSLQIHAGIEPETFKLRDVVSFQDPDYRDTQYVFVVYEATIDRYDKVTTDDEYDRIRWITLSDVRHEEITSSTNILLDIAKYGDDGNNLDTPTAPVRHKTGIIHSDGGSRGNPGPSASAYIITDHTGQTVLAQGGKFIGYSDSGMAEYTAVELALQKAIELGLTDIDFYSDNLMVVNQINGIFKVHNPEFKDVYNRVMKLLFNFRRIHFHHVHREYNSLADSLVNRILDENE